MKNRISLKGIKFAEWQSEETNCFQANIYLDGKIVGVCGNDGQGGSTYAYKISYYEDEQFNEMVRICKEYKEANDGYDAYDLLDDLFEEWLREKDAKAEAKKYETNVVYRLPDNQHTYYMVGFKSNGKVVKIADMLKSSNGRQHLKAKCDELIAQGYIISNNNINFLN